MFKRITNVIVVVALFLWQLLLQPIWNLRVEKWAAENNIGDGVGTAASSLASGHWQRMVSLVDYFTSGFLQGAAALAAIFLAYDAILYLRNRKKTPVSSYVSSLAIEIPRLQNVVRNFNSTMRQNPRIRTGVPQSLTVEDAARIRAAFAQMNKLGLKTPPLRDRIGREDAKTVEDYFSTMYPFLSSRLAKEAKREATKFIAGLPK